MPGTSSDPTQTNAATATPVAAAITTRRARANPKRHRRMASRPDHLRSHLCLHHHFSLSAGEGRRHQHDAVA